MKYIPDFKYILIDIARFDDELLENLKDNEYISDRGESMLAQSIDELIEESREEGIEKGIEKGREEEKLETVRKMLTENLDVKMISHITGLSLSEIEKLKNK